MVAMTNILINATTDCDGSWCWFLQLPAATQCVLIVCLFILALVGIYALFFG